MSNKYTTIGGLLLLVSALVLGACTPEKAPEPTVDTNAIFTAAAQTVQAQLTETAAALPTATETASPEPTNTLELPTLAPAGADAAGLMTATPLFTLAPLPGAATATLPLPSSGDKAEWVGQSPADDTQLNPGQKFDIVWTIRNVGTKTWNKSYTIRYFAGDKLSERNTYNFRAEVKPGETTTVIADAIAPAKVGEYYTWWKLVNDQGQNFGDVDLRIKIGKPNYTATPDLADFCLEEDYYNNHEETCEKFCADHSLDCPSK